MGERAKGGKERKGRRVCKSKDEVSQDNVFLNNRHVLITVHSVWFLAQTLKISQLDIGKCSWHCKMIGQRSKKEIISQLRFWNKNSSYSKRKKAKCVFQKKVLYISNSRSQSRCLGENKGLQLRRHFLSTAVIEYLDPQTNIILNLDLEVCFLSSKCRKREKKEANRISIETFGQLPMSLRSPKMLKKSGYVYHGKCEITIFPGLPGFHHKVPQTSDMTHPS